MPRPAPVRVVGPLSWIVWPTLIALAVTIVLGTPIKLFRLSPPEPVIPLVLAFAWPLIRPSVLAPLALFAAGLFLDLFWGGPTGLWPLALLAVYGLTLFARNFIVGQERRVLFAWYVGGVLLAYLIVYVAVAVQAQNAPSVIALVFGILPTILLFPAANWMIETFDDGDMRFR
ncbi:hypothetical protein Q0812_02125 [Brevundimonas sp. 2R-24]|uniref:Rod shape-determining protein MreD n=1 Tax=Peiella sedimenti TaxID=3061083 RepID=A0ABT8SK70_9CAUL|nr:hypothetical protein [Caulobacteraceae bacterium XZ-24]